MTETIHESTAVPENTAAGAAALPAAAGTAAPGRPAPSEVPRADLPPLVPDLDADPMDGIPAALLDLTGAYDRDTAGGCG